MNQFAQNKKGESERRLLEYLHSSGLRPGDQLPSEREMAAHLGLGRAALRPLLARLEDQNFIERRPQSGTFLVSLPPQVAAAEEAVAATGPVRIALIAPFQGSGDLERRASDPFWFHRVASSFERVVTAAGADLALFDQSPHVNDPCSIKNLAHEAIRWGAQSAVLLHPYGGREKIVCALGLLHDASVHPLIISARTYPGFASQVYFDSGWGVHLATAHLISKGHTKIGFVGASIGHEWVRERLAGFQNALASAEIACDAAWAWLPPDPPGSERLATEADYLQAFAHFQTLPLEKRPTALVAANDVLALGLLHAAQNAHVAVPEEMSLIGFDDDPEAMLAGLTTIARADNALGEAEARIVLERFTARPFKDAVSVRLRPVFVERRTVAAPIVCNPMEESI